jgi:hypothetical protein
MLLTLMELEETLDLLYKGTSNVAIKAKETGVSLEEMKRLLNLYISQRPVDPDVWLADVELSWPWM